MKLLYIDTITDRMITGIYEINHSEIVSLSYSDEGTAREGEQNFPLKFGSILVKQKFKNPMHC